MDARRRFIANVLQFVSRVARGTCAKQKKKTKVFPLDIHLTSPPALPKKKKNSWHWKLQQFWFESFSPEEAAYFPHTGRLVAFTLRFLQTALIVSMSVFCGACKRSSITRDLLLIFFALPLDYRGSLLLPFSLYSVHP